MGDSEGLDVGDVVGGDVTTGGGIGGQIVPAQTAEQVPLGPPTQAAAATTKLTPGGRVPSAVAVASVTIVVTPVLSLKKTKTVAIATNEKLSLRSPVGVGVSSHSHSSNTTLQLKAPALKYGSHMSDFILSSSGHWPSIGSTGEREGLAVVGTGVVSITVEVEAVVVSSVVTTTAVDVDPLLDDVDVVVVASVASVLSVASTVLDDSVLALSVAAELEVESSGASAPPANSVVVVTVLSATVEDVVVVSYYMNKNRYKQVV